MASIHCEQCNGQTWQPALARWEWWGIVGHVDGENAAALICDACLDQLLHMSRQGVVRQMGYRYVTLSTD